jgi:hypothetical protein
VGELRGAEARDEVAAPDPPVLFQPFEHGVDEAEAAWNDFRVQGLARHDAVACEELLCDGGHPFRRGGLV